MRPGSSRVSRSAMAMASASSRSSAASMRAMPSAARLAQREALGGRDLRPAVRGFRRTQGLRTRAAGAPSPPPNSPPRIVTASRPICRSLVEEPPQGGLRMAGNGIAAVRAAGDRPKTLLVEVGVEAGQNDGAVRQSRDGGKERGGRRHRAGGAGGDDRPIRPVPQQALRLGAQERVAPRRRVARVAIGELARPIASGDIDELAGDLEILGIFGLDRPRELSQGTSSVVKESISASRSPASATASAGEDGTRNGTSGAESQRIAVDRRRPALDQVRQDQPALEGLDRRRQSRRIVEAGGDRIDLGPVGLVEGTMRGRSCARPPPRAARSAASARAARRVGR